MENPLYPLLILPAPGQPADRANKSGRGGKINYPSLSRQVRRLTPRFTALRKTFEDRSATLRIEATGIIPEDVLVLETVGAVDDFIVAVRHTPGLEWLGEIEDEDIPPDEDFFALDKKGNRKEVEGLRRSIYLVFFNQAALNQLLSLWRRWQRGQPFELGLGKWKAMFSQLRDLRPWGPEDRLRDTNVIDDWKIRIAHGQESVPCELELWFRKSEGDRRLSQERTVKLVNDLGGRLINYATINEINYHSLLVEMPITAIQKVLDRSYNEVSLVQCEKIQYFRATGQMSALVREGERVNDSSTGPTPPMPSGDPVIALFDGLPLQNHNRLNGRMIIDDPDNIETLYQAQERRHGTAMASLIIHGELDSNENPLSRPIYVHPILQPDHRAFANPRPETASEFSLVVDLIHRAVRRLFEREGDEQPVAPSVCIINFSIGIIDRLFDRSLSPLARLLDWLSWRYKVLFLVSAGNHQHDIVIDVLRDQFPALDRTQVQTAVLKSIGADARNRRLLSPAEAINVLTIGALHADRSGASLIPRAIDPFLDDPLPSPVNAQGMGYRRAIKPEILLSGGKVVLQQKIDPRVNTVLEIYKGSLAPGQRVAAPGAVPGDTAATWYTRGTSNATALASRSSAILYEMLQVLRQELGGEIIGTVPTAVWLKVLLVHGVQWGHGVTILDRALGTPENRRHFREYITRLLGYGFFEISRVLECSQQRVTALSGGLIRSDESHIHRFPLPPSLSGQNCWRRLVVTLAWFTPVNPNHRAWRKADLYFTPPNEELQVDRKQADARAAGRGSVQHEILEGEKASVFRDGDHFEIRVSCRAETGLLEEDIPYALAITLEVNEEVGIPIYEEVRVRVQAARIGITPTD